jgi:glucose/arabinose dehydrogenase
LQLNHGLELSEDGRTLYASSDNTVFAWDYDSSTGRTTSDARELVTDMSPDGQGHVTRTLLLSRRVPGLLLVSRGSVGNIDLQTLDPKSGVSTIKAFNLTNITGSAYVHASDGLLVGWGLRNSVGVAEEPTLGGIYSVENSVDNIQRNGQNVHENNPGEEMNFHGYLNGTETKETGGNYGYPTCFAAWNPSEIPDFDGKTGTQFAMGDQNATVNDTFCREDRVAPRITFPAHQAPLDIKFNPNGTAAWVTMHGSW